MFTLYFTFWLKEIEFDTVFMNDSIFYAQLRDRPPLMDKELHTRHELKIVEYVWNNRRLLREIPI